MPPVVTAPPIVATPYIAAESPMVIYEDPCCDRAPYYVENGCDDWSNGNGNGHGKMKKQKHRKKGRGGCGCN